MTDQLHQREGESVSEAWTDAGRAFIADWEPADGPDDTVERAILAIEAQARAAALKEVAERVEKLWRDKGWQSIEDSAAKAAVLALLSTEEGS